MWRGGADQCVSEAQEHCHSLALHGWENIRHFILYKLLPQPHHRQVGGKYFLIITMGLQNTPFKNHCYPSSLLSHEAGCILAQPKLRGCHVNSTQEPPLMSCGTSGRGKLRALMGFNFRGGVGSGFLRHDQAWSWSTCRDPGEGKEPTEVPGSRTPRSEPSCRSPPWLLFWVSDTVSLSGCFSYLGILFYLRPLKNKITSFVGKCMELEIFVVSKISQIQKDTIFFNIWNLLKSKKPKMTWKEEI